MSETIIVNFNGEKMYVTMSSYKDNYLEIGVLCEYRNIFKSTSVGGDYLYRDLTTKKWFVNDDLDVYDTAQEAIDKYIENKLN